MFWLAVRTPVVGGFLTTTCCTPGQSFPTTTSMVEPKPGFSTRVAPGIEAATVRAESLYSGSYRTMVEMKSDDSACVDAGDVEALVVELVRSFGCRTLFAGAVEYAQVDVAWRDVEWLPVHLGGLGGGGWVRRHR